LLPVTGLEGIVPKAIDEVPHVLTVAATEGRFGAAESTGVTRVSYDVPASRPVTVEDVDDVLAVKVVHAESEAFLNTTL
jgi:hypothetical protein